MRVTVTENDIELAHRADNGACAIVLAIAREYPRYRNIRVTADEIRYTDRDSDERLFYRTPNKAREFIHRFDNGERVEPLAFSVDWRSLIKARAAAARTPQDIVNRRTQPPPRRTGERTKRPTNAE